MSWLQLYTAILLEVGGTTFLKIANGLNKPVFFVSALVLYGLSFLALSYAMKVLPVGTSYAIWSGLGTVLAFMVGMIWFGESFGLQKMALVTVIVLATIGLNLTPE